MQFDRAGDLETIDVDLAPLANNGGPTPTHLVMGGPAIDSGDLDRCPATDQRGFIRPAGERCDIGAAEMGAEPGVGPEPTATPDPIDEPGARDARSIAFERIRSSAVSGPEGVAGSVHDVVLERGRLFAAIGMTVAAFDARDPTRPVYFGHLALDTAAGRIALDGDRLLVNRFDCVQVVDMSIPGAPRSIGFAPFPGGLDASAPWEPGPDAGRPTETSLTIAGDLVIATQYIRAEASSPRPVYRIGVVDPSDDLPRWTNALIEETCCGAHLEGARLRVGHWVGRRESPRIQGFLEYDISDPAAPAERWRHGYGQMQSIVGLGDRLAVGTVGYGERGYRIVETWQRVFDISTDPPEKIGQLMYSSGTMPYGGAWDEDMLWWLDRPAQGEDYAPRVMAASFGDGRLRSHGDVALLSEASAIAVDGGVGRADFERPIAGALEVVGDIAYTLMISGEIVGWDIADPTSIRPNIGHMPPRAIYPDNGDLVAMGDRLAVVRDTVEIFERRGPFLDSLGSPPAPAGAVAASAAWDGRNLLVAGAGGGVYAIDVDDAGRMALVGAHDTPGTAHDLAIAGDRIYVADGDGGIRVIRYGASTFGPLSFRVGLPRVGAGR